MRSKRRLATGAALVVSALAVSTLMAPAATATVNGEDGVGWEYHEDGDGYVRTPPEQDPDGDGSGGGGGGEPKPVDGYYWNTEVGNVKKPDEPYKDDYTWWCDGANNDSTRGDTRDKTCEAPEHEDFPTMSSFSCNVPGSDGRPQLPYIRLRQKTDWPGAPNYTGGDWDYYDWKCVPLEDDNWVSTEDITEEVDYSVFQKLGAPKIDIDPGANGYVNLPTIVSTDYPADLEGPGEVVSRDPVTIKVPIEVERPSGNLHGEITATADFSWSFEGGGTAEGPGKPYTKAKDPLNDGGYYNSKTWTTTGMKTVTLNVEWAGTVEVDGLEPEPIDPVKIEAASEEIEIKELSPVLGR